MIDSVIDRRERGNGRRSAVWADGVLGGGHGCVRVDVAGRRETFAGYWRRPLRSRNGIEDFGSLMAPLVGGEGSG